MKRKPRNPEEPILPTGLMLWLGCIGLVMGATTIGVIAWADHHYDTAIARTMGMTSFAMANLLYSFCERDQLQSVFSLDVLRDRKFLYFSGALADRDLDRPATRSAEQDPRNAAADAAPVADLHRRCVRGRRDFRDPQGHPATA